MDTRKEKQNRECIQEETFEIVEISRSNNDEGKQVHANKQI